MRFVTLPDFLTAEEIIRAEQLYHELKGTGRLAEAIEREIIIPNLMRINAALRRRNSPRALACGVEHVFAATEQKPPRPEFTDPENRCYLCGERMGDDLRARHLGRCDSCARATIVH